MTSELWSLTRHSKRENSNKTVAAGKRNGVIRWVRHRGTLMRCSSLETVGPDADKQLQRSGEENIQSSSEEQGISTPTQ